MNEWLQFDIQKIKLLKEDYEGAMSYIEEGLPNINFNSRKEVLNFFEKTFKIKLQTTRIKELSQYLAAYKEDSIENEMITGIVYYFKMKYTLKNYIDCILRHEKGGRVELRNFLGKISLPNRQPLPYSKEIQAAIIDGSETALNSLPKGDQNGI